MASELPKLLEAIARFRENEVRAQELANGNASGYYETNASPFQKVETFPHFMERIGREFDDQVVVFQSQGSGAIDSFKKDGTIAISGVQSAGGKAIQGFINDGNTAISGFISKGDMAIAGFNTSGEKTISDFVNSGDTAIADFKNESALEISTFKAAGEKAIIAIFDEAGGKYAEVYRKIDDLTWSVTTAVTRLTESAIRQDLDLDGLGIGLVSAVKRVSSLEVESVRLEYEISEVGGGLEALGRGTAVAVTRLTESAVRQDLEIDGLRAGFANAAGDIGGLNQIVWQNAVAVVRNARAAILNTNHILALM